MARILLIDDDPVLTKLYSTRLSVDKHQVKTSNNGEEGLKLVAEFKPNLVVLDLMMPKLNGFKFIDALKASKDYKNMPILVFSSVADPEKTKSLKEKGVNGVLNKIDVTPTQLVNIINTYLSKK